MELNRRRLGRVDVKLPAKYRIVQEEKGEVLLEGEAIIANISRDGMCLRIDVTHAKAIADLFKNKYQLQVEFVLPSSAKLIKPLSKIVWTENLESEGQTKFNMGLYFVEFNEEERIQLIDFLNVEYIKHKRSF